MEDRDECFDNGEGGESDDDDDDDGPGVTFRTEDYEGMGGGMVAAGPKGAQKGGPINVDEDDEPMEDY